MGGIVVNGIVHELIQDVFYGLRLMRRAPGFTAAVVLTLAVGIGANAATFSVVDVLELTPLAYRNPERVAFVFGWNIERQERRFNLPLADAVALGAQATSLEAVAAYLYWSANLTGIATPERIQAYRVTANMFALLGVEALHGRTIVPADGQPGGGDVVVLSHGLWRRRFGGSPSVIGQTVTLDGRPHTIVGVMPQRFEFPVFNFKGEAWTPLKVDTAAGLSRESSPSIVAIARLKAGVRYTEAQAELDAIMRRFAADYPLTNRGLGARLLEMRRVADENGAGSISAILLCAVAFVLLLACANIAHLLLARAISREREMTVRAAIGASRGRLVRQLLTESALLSAAGSLAGLVVAAVTVAWLRASLPELLVVTQPNVLELGIDRTTLLYTAGLGMLSAVFFGAAPAIRAARAGLLTSLKSGGHATATLRHTRLRAALLVAEVTVAVVLLVCAGLLVRAVERLRHVDPGFNPRSLLTMTVSLPEYRYGAIDAQRTFFTSAVERVRQVVGVRDAALGNVLPFSTYDSSTRYTIVGRPVEPGLEPAAAYRLVTPDYFRTLEIPISAGRPFDSRDTSVTQQVAIVNRTLARRAFGEVDPIGRQIRLGRANSTGTPRTIVGVAGDVLHSQLTRRPNPEIYVPFDQAPAPTMFLAARTNGDPDRFADAVRAALASVDPTQPVYHVKTMGGLVDAALLPNTSAMAMMSLFAALALLLSIVGIYGVTSHGVRQQTRELGIRLALGAAPRDVLDLVFRRSLTLVAVGTVSGATLAIGAGRALAAALPGVRGADVLTYGAVAALLLAVGAVACYVPARRATRLDPVEILRAD